MRIGGHGKTIPLNPTGNYYDNLWWNHFLLNWADIYIYPLIDSHYRIDIISSFSFLIFLVTEENVSFFIEFKVGPARARIEEFSCDVC
jgi:hypothetical protein